MKDRYRMYRRSNGTFYLEDVGCRKQESLRTKSAAEAKRLLAARNQAVEQPALNLTMARAYLSGRSPELMSRTWADVLDEMALNYHGPTATYTGVHAISVCNRILAHIEAELEHAY
jgi:hypothetical protein